MNEKKLLRYTGRIPLSNNIKRPPSYYYSEIL